MARCFLFKPDGIGDFFLATGVIRLMAREYGEENLTIAVLPNMESVVRGQFPKATPVILPIRKKRVILNVFVANCLRCFRPWISMRGMKVDVALCLRHMRDYLQTFLFYSVPCRKRFLASNLLLGNGRPVRRRTEHLFQALFSPVVVPNPFGKDGIPTELETNRILSEAVLGREVGIREIWPHLRPVGNPPLQAPYFVCAPFSSDIWKDFPEERWIEVFESLLDGRGLPFLVLTGSGDQFGKLEAFREQCIRSRLGVAVPVRVIIPPTLQDFIDLLAGADCVLTVDTAAAHASTALDRKTLILFSGLHHGMFAPWVRSARQRWILPNRPGEGCYWHSALENGEIRAALEEILAASS